MSVLRERDGDHSTLKKLYKNGAFVAFFLKPFSWWKVYSEYDTHNCDNIKALVSEYDIHNCDIKALVCLFDLVSINLFLENMYNRDLWGSVYGQHNVEQFWNKRLLGHF